MNDKKDAPRAPKEKKKDGFIPEYPEELKDKLMGRLKTTAKVELEDFPLIEGDTPYRLTFYCSGSHDPVVFPKVGGVNDLSMTLACLGAALELQPSVVGFEVENLITGETIASVGLRAFLSMVSPRIGAAVGRTIVHPAQLSEKQVENFTKPEKES